MKTISTFFLLITLSLLHYDDRIVGSYKNYFGGELKLYADNSFKFNWQFDMASNWTSGKWKCTNDTIYFQIIPVYDTLRLKNKKDTLVLSFDDKPEMITENNYSGINFIFPNHQNSERLSKKLFFREGKLIEIKKSGKLDLSKKKQFWSDEKYYTWYFKE